MKYKITYKMKNKYLFQCLKLDESSFEEEDQGSYIKCKEWLSINNKIYTILLHKGQAIGYINFIGITKQCYEKFMLGKYKDYMLTKEDILPFHLGNNYALFMSIVIHSDYRNSDAIIALTNAFKHKIQKFKKHHIIFDNCVMDCVSNDGIKYGTRNFDAKYVCDSHDGKIHTINVYK